MAAPVPATANQFLQLAEKSGVIDAGQFAAAFPDPDALPRDPSGCANALIKAGLLTRYQAEQLLAGRFRGFKLGPYKILQPLGKGGMGMVYLGEHEELRRKVAIKVLPQAQAADTLVRERFFREGRSAAALNHPNIVRLYDISQAAGVNYLALEYVDGEDLESLVSKRGAIPCADAVRFVTAVAAGLTHAHEKGFVHRDIKPSNIMVGKDGVVKILDMGLARSFENTNDNLTANLAGEGEAVGTADYVSPEQALCQPVDARGDVYSLGATLFALLSGHPPFKGNMTQLLLHHQLTEVSPLPRSLNIPDVDDLDDVLATMMAKDPDDRYQSAAEVAEALAPWLTARPAAPRPASGRTAEHAALTETPRPLARSTAKLRSKRSATSKTLKAPRVSAKEKKKKAMALAGGGLVVFIVIVVVVLAFSGGSTPAAKNTTPAEEPRRDGAQVPAAVLRPNGSPAPTPPVTESSTRLGGAIGNIQDIAISPDGKRAAVIDHGGPLQLWETNPPRLLRPISPPNGGKFYSASFTPDGKQFVAGGQNMPTQLIECETGRVVREYRGHIDTTWAVAVSPDGQTVVTCGNDSSVTLRKLESGDEIRSFELDAKTQWCVAFSADGTKYAAGSGSGPNDAESNVVRVWDAATGKELHKLVGHSKDVRWVTFRGDGQALASGSFDGTVRTWNLTTGKEATVIPAQSGGYVERVFYLPDGKRLVTCGGPLGGGNGEPGTLRVWDVASGVVAQSWGGEEGGGLIALDVARSGEFALTGGRNKLLRMWKLPK